MLTGPADQHSSVVVQTARELLLDGRTTVRHACICALVSAAQINPCLLNCLDNAVALGLAKELAVISNGRASVTLERGMCAFGVHVSEPCRRD